MHKNIPIHKAEGRRITTVYDAGHGYKSYRSNTKVPDSHKLFNFDLKFGDRTLLVLDDYGHETLAGSDIEPHVLEGGRLRGDLGYTLGIDRGTGIIHAIGFGIEKRKCIAITWEFSRDPEGKPLRFPRRLLKQIDKLKSAKRPYDILIPPHYLAAFIDRSIGYQELAQNLVVQFDFRPKGFVEVWGSSHRLVSEWA